MKKVSCAKGLLLACGLAAVCLSAKGADGGEGKKVALDWSADVVSSYVWRGAECAGFSVQPGVTLAWPRVGLSVGAWASAELFERRQMANMSEFDLTGAYEVGRFTATLTDYFFCDAPYLATWRFNSAASHRLEATVAYDFGALSVAWSTCLTGPDHQADGDRIYSSYVEMSAPFRLGGLGCRATLGMVPWEDGGFICCDAAMPSHKTNVVNLALEAEKEVKGVPLVGRVTYNPYTEATYFVVGVHF